MVMVRARTMAMTTRAVTVTTRPETVKTRGVTLTNQSRDLDKPEEQRQGMIFL